MKIQAVERPESRVEEGFAAIRLRAARLRREERIEEDGKAETTNQFSKLLSREPHICGEPGFGTIPVLADNDSSLTTDRKPDNW